MKPRIWCGGAALALAVATACPAATVDFTQANYTVQAGQAFSVSLRYDPFPAQGLFSGGLRLTYPAGSAAAGSQSDIVIPADFAGDGLGGHPTRQVGAGFAAFNTATNRPDMTYTGGGNGLLATISLTNQATAGTYTLTLADFDGTANTTEFVTGQGAGLSPTFGTATVTVVPEPALGGLAAIVAMTALGRRRHQRA